MLAVEDFFERFQGDCIDGETWHLDIVVTAIISFDVEGKISSAGIEATAFGEAIGVDQGVWANDEARSLVLNGVGEPMVMAFHGEGGPAPYYTALISAEAHVSAFSEGVDREESAPVIGTRPFYNILALNSVNAIAGELLPE